MLLRMQEDRGATDFEVANYGSIDVVVGPAGVARRRLNELKRPWEQGHGYYPTNNIYVVDFIRVTHPFEA